MMQDIEYTQASYRDSNTTNPPTAISAVSEKVRRWRHSTKLAIIIQSFPRSTHGGEALSTTVAETRSTPFFV